MPALNKLHEEFRDRAAFYVVYIQEAHPIDAWQVDSNVKESILVASSTTHEERAATANRCVKELGLELPALVDEPDNRVERAWTGWPDRLYVVGVDGRIAYKSGPGPFGFNPEEVEATLRRLLVTEPAPSPGASTPPPA